MCNYRNKLRDTYTHTDIKYDDKKKLVRRVSKKYSAFRTQNLRKH